MYTIFGEFRQFFAKKRRYFLKQSTDQYFASTSGIFS
jgi:hypothetical protein